MATDDVAALKTRIPELESAKTTRRFDGRGFSAWIVLVVAALLFPIALTAFWAQQTVVDTERYISTVAPLSEDPTIQKAVGETVTNAIVKQLDLQTTVAGLLSDYPRLAPLSGPLASGVNGFIGTTVDKILASDQFSEVWVQINTKAQQALIGALTNEPTGAVTIQGDQVVLDTGDLITLVKQKLVDRGLSFAANIPVPPAADREVVLLTAPQLSEARTIYAIAQPIAAWLIYVVLLMFLGAILLSRRRPRMVMATGIALLLGALALRLLIVVGQGQVSLNLQGTPFGEAEVAFFTILTTVLLAAIRATFVLGLVLAIVGWFLSGTSAAVKTRAFFSGAIGGAGSKASDSAIAPVGAWFARSRTFCRVAIVAIAIAVLIISSQVTGALIAWTTIIAVIAIVIVEFLAAAGNATAAEGSATAEMESAPELTAAQVSGGTEEHPTS